MHASAEKPLQQMQDHSPVSTMREDVRRSLAPDGQAQTSSEILASLFSAYVSANGVRPAFYGHAGLKLVEGCGFIPDPKTGAIHRSSETLVWQFLMDLSYPRGEYVARLVARRICRAVDQINASGGIDFLRKAVAADKDDAREILMPLYGMGPKTFEVFWGLSREACAQSEA